LFREFATCPCRESAGLEDLWLEIAHKSIQRVYLLQNWVEAQSYWAVLFAKTANAIGLLPEKRDTGNLQFMGIDIASQAG
jgi:hypothetical protein